MTITSAFEKYRAQAYPHTWRGTLHVTRIAGGTPTDPKVAEGWLRSKTGESTDEIIRAQVAEVMVERGLSAEEATSVVNADRHLNGFKRERCPDCPPAGALACAVKNVHALYIEGRQLKAAVKEAANVRWPKDRWGPSKKGTRSFFAEHVFIQDDKLHLGVTEPTGIAQRFVHTWRGTGIQYEEYVDDAKVDFTLATDHDFTAEQWAMLWLTGEQQGIGATRSQGYGRYAVTGWERVK